MAAPTINFAGFVYDDSGDAVSGATIHIYDKNTTTTAREASSVTTNSSGYYSYSHATPGEFDVEIVKGTSKRRYKFDDKIHLSEIDVEKLSIRGNEGAIAALYLYADEGDDASDQWRIDAGIDGVIAIGNDINSQGTFVDHLTITPNSTASSSTVAIIGNATVGGALTVTGTTTLNGNLVLGDAAADSLTIGATIQGGTPLVFEGTSNDTYETSFVITDPTADRTITFPNLSGTVQLSGNPISGTTGTFTGTITGGTDGSGVDVVLYSGTAGDNLTWDASEEQLIITGTDGATSLNVADGNVAIADDLSVDGTSNLDNTDIDGTLVVDGSNISLDSTSTLNIDNSNTSNGITIATATSGVPISIGHSTSETTINDNLSVTGDAAVDGTANLDNTDIDGTLVVDGSNISLDSTSTLNIDNSNTSNGITIGTATSGVPISIGHSTSETTINDNLTVTGTSTFSDDVTISGSDVNLIMDKSYIEIQEDPTPPDHLDDHIRLFGTDIHGLGISTEEHASAKYTSVGADHLQFEVASTISTVAGDLTLNPAGGVDLGANTLTSTGSMQIRTIDYSDGDLAMTIADGGAVTFAQNVTMDANLDMEGYSAFGDGSGLDPSYTVTIDRAFSDTSQAVSLRVRGTITSTDGTGTLAGFQVQPAGTVINSGNSHNVYSAWFVEPAITETSGSANTAATVYIQNAPSEGTNNYALFVDSGVTRLDGAVTTYGDINVRGTTPSIILGDGGDEDTFIVFDADHDFYMGSGNTENAFNFGSGTTMGSNMIWQAGSNTFYFVASTGVYVKDDINFYFGTGADYKMEYESDPNGDGSGDDSRWVMWTNDTNGSGGNEDIIRILDGQKSIDANTTWDANVFDIYDDAMLLASSISPTAEAYDFGKGVFKRGKEALIEAGVLKRYKDDGWIGYNDQRMAALLAGGIYQTRWLVDEMKEKISELENKVKALGG